MKKIRTLLMVALAAVTLVSCGKEEASEMIEGTYTGYTSAKFSYSPNPIVSDDETMTITANEEKVDIACKFNRWGTMTVDKATAKESGDNVAVSGSGIALIPSMTGDGSSSYDITFNGTVAKDKSTFDITIEMPALMGGTVITYKNGKAPASDK